MIATYFAELAALAVFSWFWIPIAIVTLIWAAFVVNERGGLSTLFTVALGVMIAAKFPAFIDFVSDPIHDVALLLGYSVIGVLWSKYKWSGFLTRKLEYYKAHREKYLRMKGLDMDYFKKTDYDRGILQDYVNTLRSDVYGLGLSLHNYTSIEKLNADLAPKASENKGSIVMWIAYWPMYVVWFIIADMVTELANAIYRAVGGHFQKMSDSKFADM